MAGHTSPPPPPQEQEQEAERRLLDLHGRLWGLATELLVPTEQGDDDHHPSQRSSPSPRPPLAIIEDIKRCRAEADVFWAGRRDGGSGADGAADEERAVEATNRQKEKAQEQQLVARLRSRLLGRTTEAFADELDALRTSDGTFKGTEEDVRGLVAILEEGAEALLAEGDGATLGVYHDHLLGEGDEDGEQSAEILDEPVHVRVRREKGMLLASSSRPNKGAFAAAKDAMEESSEGGGS